jgi:phosphoribosyl-AMP cyclohydrolase
MGYRSHILPDGGAAGAVLTKTTSADTDVEWGARAVYGEIYMTDNATATTLTTQNTWYQVTAGWVVGASSGTTPSTGGTITVAATDVYMLIASTAHSNASGSNKTFEIAFFNDGAQIVKSRVIHESLGAGGNDNVSVSCIDTVNATKAVSLYARCTSHAGASITFADANVAVLRV